MRNTKVIAFERFESSLRFQLFVRRKFGEFNYSFSFCNVFCKFEKRAIAESMYLDVNH